MDSLGNSDLRGANLAADWITFLNEQDETAFKRLYTHYFHYLSFIGAKRGFSAEQVQDQINELFLYVWENVVKLQTVRNYHNYLITAFLRKLYKTDHLDTEEIGELTALPDSYIVPSAESLHIYNNINEGNAAVLKKVIDKLPERQRLMIYQKFYLGLSYNDIAETNNISINTVYNTIYKAIATLKTNFEGDNLTISALLAGLIIYFLFFFK